MLVDIDDMATAALAKQQRPLMFMILNDMAMAAAAEAMATYAYGCE